MACYGLGTGGWGIVGGAKVGGWMVGHGFGGMSGRLSLWSGEMGVVMMLVV